VPKKPWIVAMSPGMRVPVVHEAKSALALIEAEEATAALESEIIEEGNCAGAYFVLTITDVDDLGSAGLTLEVYGVDPISGAEFQLFQANDAVTATGTTVYAIHPNEPAAGNGVTQVSNRSLPRHFKVKTSVGDASEFTYTVVALTIK
jgi:hypothetical protein